MECDRHAIHRGYLQCTDLIEMKETLKYILIIFLATVMMLYEF